MKTKNAEYEQSLVRTTLVVFMEEYNRNIPESFPRATVLLLEKFQTAHPMLFKNGGKWSHAEHRKKLMDWLPAFGNGG
ncbi:hypothetical protein L0Y69_01560 [bacterium]|nr:hypothetical protein [bacterium]